ncbi:MAG TPA: ferrochelatase [Terriglobales bacterium]|nr:ferrochelatase [Terriglobales bacterium]
MAETRRVGVVLFQLGGPDSPEAIEPFLFNLFCDPDIIDFPFARLGRRPLAKLISTTRARKVAHHYASIGGCSPIRRNTERQARALEARLNDGGLAARCVVAMRYWHPFTAEAIQELDAFGCDEIVLLPLYPQYSSTTTGSSLNEWNRRFHRNGAPVHVIREFYTHGQYLDALAEKIEATLAQFPSPEEAELVFSAHSVPLSVIAKGDPYQRHIEDTVRRVMALGGWRNRHRLCYQSKVGASRWLQPSLRATVRELGAAGAEQVCVVPISFVSDHVETLGEIDHEARELAGSLGIREFRMTPGLNDSPRFIAALAGLVMGQIRNEELEMQSEEPETRLVAAD